MSSRFVSAGGEEVEPPEGLSAASDDAWTKARKQVEDSKKTKQEGPEPGTQEGGKSLYEHLQAQKAAKQEAFEEATKLRNQFRPLDDGEVDFLEGLKQNERLRASENRKETEQQLELFRKERAAAEEAARDETSRNEEVPANKTESESWTTTKKRRRPQTDEKADSAKSRKMSSIGDDSDTVASTKLNSSLPGAQTEEPVKPIPVSEPKDNPKSIASAKAISSLVAYGSDSDSDSNG